MSGAPNRVSTMGMYDMHLFHQIEGTTVDEVIANWQAHNQDPPMGNVGDMGVINMGKSVLCPVIVLVDDVEVRRVGPMVFEDEARIEEFRKNLKADPDIPRLLAERAQ